MNTTAQKTATKKAATTTKVTDAVKLSSLDKKLIRLGELKAKQEKETLNLVEIKSVLNILLMLEDKNPSQLYNKLSKSKNADIKQYVKLALGKSPMPKYGEFLAELTKKNKPLYANYDGITVLTKFNKAAQLKTKAEKQNKVVAAI